MLAPRLACSQPLSIMSITSADFMHMCRCCTGITLCVRHSCCCCHVLQLTVPMHCSELKQGAGLQPDKVVGHLELERLSFSYPSRLEAPVFTDFCLTVEPGQRVALVGPSGSGTLPCLLIVIAQLLRWSKGIIAL